MRKELAIQEWGTYQGSGVKPTDFDVYWEEAKAEVDGKLAARGTLTFAIGS